MTAESPQLHLLTSHLPESKPSQAEIKKAPCLYFPRSQSDSEVPIQAAGEHKADELPWHLGFESNEFCSDLIWGIPLSLLAGCMTQVKCSSTIWSQMLGSKHRVTGSAGEERENRGCRSLQFLKKTTRPQKTPKTGTWPHQEKKKDKQKVFILILLGFSFYYLSQPKSTGQKTWLGL